MRPGVTLEDVTRAADLLLEKGDRPTIEGVRGVLGTGSPATVNAHLKAYYQALPARLNLPAPIATAAAQLYQSIRDAAQVEVDQIEGERRAALDTDRAALEGERRAYESEKNQLQAQTTALAADLAAARDQLAASQRQLAALQVQIADALRAVSTAEARAEAAIEERDRAARKHQEEIEQLRARADGNERHLLAQIEEQRTQNRRLIAEREKEQAATVKRIADLDAAIAQFSKDLAEQRKDAIRLSAELSREQRARSVAEASLSAAADAHERELVSLQTQRDQLRADRDHERARADRLAHERDSAAGDAAGLRGRLEGLEAQLDRLAPAPARSKSGRTKADS